MIVRVSEWGPHGIRCQYHLGFRWRDTNIITLACNGTEVDASDLAFIDEEPASGAQPPVPMLCRECASLSVAELDARYEHWMHNELVAP